MAASGFTPISLYYSTTASAVPTSGNLANGELGLNIADMKLYAKNSAGVVTLLASNAATSGVSSFSAGTTGFTPSTATTGAITLAGTLNVANGGTGLTTLTANRIPYGNGTSAFQSSANLTFDGSTLTGTTVNVRLSNDYKVGFGDGTSWLSGNGSTGYLTFGTNNTERGRFSVNGNLMLGTTTGTERLTLANTVGVGAAMAFWANGVGAGSELYVGQGGSNEAYFYNRANGFIAIATNNIERIRVLAGGNTGFGLTDPPYVLSASSNSPQFYLRNPGYGGYIVSTNTDTSFSFTKEGVGERTRVTPNGGWSVGTTADPGAGAIYATGAITAFFSDKRLKTVRGKIQNALDKVAKLSGVYYTFNDTAKSYGYDSDEEHVGVIAQEVEAVLPQIVKAAPFDLDENNNSKSGQNYKTVQYDKLTPLLIEAINELRAKVTALKGTI